MFKSMYKKFLVESEENIESYLVHNEDGHGKIILKVNDIPEAIIEYEYDQEHCCIQFLETYVHENQGYATKLLLKLKEVLKRKNIKTVSAQATLKSQHLLTKVFGEPVDKDEEGYWDEGIGDDIYYVKHQFNEAYLVEARSEYLLQNKKLVKAIASRYLKQFLTQEEYVRMSNSEDFDRQCEKVVKDRFIYALENKGHPYISKYLLWVLKQYADGYWKFPEDIEKLEKELEQFSKLNHTLEKRDINQYTYEDFADTVLKLEGQYTENEKERMIKENQAEKVFENENWLLIHPLTKEADILYGKGTRWCTAATDSYNYFDHYNKDGPLYILINKTDPSEKYQFHWETSSFMNKLDYRIDDEEKEKILADPELKAKLQEIADKYLGTPENYADVLYNACNLDISPTTAEQIRPDKNGMCHLTIIDSVFENMYSDGRDDLSWKFVSAIFSQEGLFEVLNMYDLDIGDIEIDLNSEQYKAISKILVDNGLPTIPETTLEYLIATRDGRIAHEYDVFLEIFEEALEETDLYTYYRDCYNSGTEKEATEDVERQILNYFGYNARFEWAGKNQEERVIKLDVPAKDLKFPTEEIKGPIFPESHDNYSESYSVYLVNTLYDGEECAVYEPQYGWNDFDREYWDTDFMNSVYIPKLKEIIEKNPERNKKIRKEWEEETSLDESHSIKKAVNIITEHNVSFKNNTFKQVFKKIEG